MGKSKETKSVNKDLSNEYKYQSGQRQQNDSYWNPRIEAGAGNSAGSRAGLESSIGGLSDYANSMPGSAGNVDTGQMSGDAAAYRNFAQGNTESGQFFRNLMNTGGFTEGELGDIRTVGNRQIPSFFANLRNKMRTAQNTTGGYSPGYSSSAAAMARDAAHMGQDAALDTELGISDRVHQGKLTGAGGLERAFLGGMGGASNLDEAIARTQLGNEGLNLQAQGMKAGALGDVSRAYGSLYGQDQGDLQNSEAMRMRAQGMSDEAISQNLGIRTQYNPNKGRFNFGGALSGAGSGAASGAMFGPWGAVAGGLIGGVAGGLKG